MQTQAHTNVLKAARIVEQADNISRLPKTMCTLIWTWPGVIGVMQQWPIQLYDKHNTLWCTHVITFHTIKNIWIDQRGQSQ